MEIPPGKVLLGIEEAALGLGRGVQGRRPLARGAASPTPDVPVVAQIPQVPLVLGEQAGVVALLQSDYHHSRAEAQLLAGLRRGVGFGNSRSRVGESELRQEQLA